MTFRIGERVRSTSGIEGRVAVPSSSAAIQQNLYVAHGQNETTTRVVTEDGEVRRFLDSALTSLEMVDEGE